MSNQRTGRTSPLLSTDLRGAGRLAIDGIVGVTDVVEAMHATIAHLPAMAGRHGPRTTRGVTGFVYGAVRRITRLVGTGVDASLAALAPVIGDRTRSHSHEALVAALNGVFGDHLQASANPLAINMQLRHAGESLPLTRDQLARHVPHASGKVMVFVHGLCMNDLQWAFAGHDRGVELARELGFSPIHLHYNTGLRIAENGHAFAELLERAVESWPIPVDELVLVCHSMGGLVARGAIDAGLKAGYSWATQPLRVFFLGTPHAGAPLERAGAWLDLLLRFSPYSAPIASVGRARSAGIKDLRDGVFNENGGPAPIPSSVRAYVIAATRSKSAPGTGALRSDGLVPVASALGEHPRRAFNLNIPDARRWVAQDMHHLDLLHSPAVFQRIRDWIEA